MIKNFYVVTVISNPVRFKSRYHLYQNFKRKMLRGGAKLITVEVAYGDRPFEVTCHSDPYNIQLRTWEELWHKENMINVAIQRLPRDWEYVAWIDADIDFIREDILDETVHKLQHHHVVQMFQSAIDLGPDGNTIGLHKSFMSEYHRSGCMPENAPYTKWHPGYAWAARREAIDHLGGVIDVGILGSGDRHMAGALIGQVHKTYNTKIHHHYKDHLKRWQHHAERYIRRDVGFVSGTIVHHWHGKKRDRQYGDRWKILVEHSYSPLHDLKKDWQGLYQLSDHGNLRSIKLRDDIRRYFATRNEDSVDLE